MKGTAENWVGGLIIIFALTLFTIFFVKTINRPPPRAPRVLATPKIQEAGRILGIDATTDDENHGFGNQAAVILELAKRVKALEEKK